VRLIAESKGRVRNGSAFFVIGLQMEKSTEMFTGGWGDCGIQVFTSKWFGKLVIVDGNIHDWGESYERMSENEVGGK